MCVFLVNVVLVVTYC